VIAVSIPMPVHGNVIDRLNAARAHTLAMTDADTAKSTFFGKELILEGNDQTEERALSFDIPTSLSLVPSGDEAFGLFRAMVLAKLARIVGSSFTHPFSPQTRSTSFSASDLVRATFVTTPPLLPEDSTESLVSLDPVSLLEIDAIGFTAADGSNSSEIRAALGTWPQPISDDLLRRVFVVRLRQNALLQCATRWISAELSTLGFESWLSHGDSLFCEATSPHHVALIVRRANAWLGTSLSFRVQTVGDVRGRGKP
jgi:hypothetical protein